MLFSVGLTCQHVSQAVDMHHVKRAVAQSVWSICAECLKERRVSDGEPGAPSDIWLCLKCGSQVSRCAQVAEVEFLKDMLWILVCLASYYLQRSSVAQVLSCERCCFSFLGKWGVTLCSCSFLAVFRVSFMCHSAVWHHN